MAALGNNVKMAFLKGLEALGKGASNMASNAHQKLNEINLETRRRELLSEIPVRALDLWQQGEPMPESLAAMLRELSDLDEQLTVLRAQRYARVEAEEQADAPEGETPSPDAGTEPEDAEADATYAGDESYFTQDVPEQADAAQDAPDFAPAPVEADAAAADTYPASAEPDTAPADPSGERWSDGNA